MPENRYYTVTQVREIQVQANEPAQAVSIANSAFKAAKETDHIQSHRVSPIRELSISAREDK